MTNRISIVLILILMISCSDTKFDSHDHSHGESNASAEGSGHDHSDDELVNIKFTEFSDHYELFAEMTPFIVNNESEFVVHLTKLSDFKPITDGSLWIELRGSVNEDILVEYLSRDGIFITGYVPEETGNIDITFLYDNGEIIDSFEVASQKVYADEEEAIHTVHSDDKGITFLKEEAWMIDFSLIKIQSNEFNSAVKASGKIINKPADEMIITAYASGTVQIIDKSLMIGKNISSGQHLFSIKPGSVREDNLSLRYAQAKSNYDRAKREFERVSELYDSKITSEKEYLAAKSEFENIDAVFQNYSGSSEGKVFKIKSPGSGFLKELYIIQGQFVEAGSQIAAVSNNSELLIQVELPQSDYVKLGRIIDANVVVNENTYKLEELNGKVIGSPVSSGLSSYVTLFIEIDNKVGLLPNTYSSVYLIGKGTTDALTIPSESLWEDRGNYFVFVQKNGELFEKRLIEINGYDGYNYLIKSGLESGEVIVNKGMYRVMLASKTSDLPSQTHAH